MSEEESVGYAIATIILVVIASFITGGIVDASWRREMVNRGYAEYDSKTAEWKWRTHGDDEK